MKCQKCGEDNKKGSKYCEECGAKITPEKKYLNEIIFSKKWIWIVSTVIILAIIIFPFTLIFKKPADIIGTEDKELLPDKDEEFVEVVEETPEKVEEVEEVVETTENKNVLLKTSPGKIDMVIKDIEFSDVFLSEGQESIDKQKEQNTFSLSYEELINIERADLRFVPYCNHVSNVGILDISINNQLIFSAIPLCGEPYKQEIASDILYIENFVVFNSRKGYYDIGNIKIEFEEKDTHRKFYEFELNMIQMSNIGTGRADVILTIEFADNSKTKKFDLSVNGKFATIDQKERIFTKNLNDYVEQGNNFIEIRPRTMLDISELKVEIINIET